MQSEIPVHYRASRTLWSSGDVPLPRGAAQRSLCLAREPAYPAGSERCPGDRSDTQSLKRQKQGLWLPQAARRPVGSRRDLLPEPGRQIGQAGGHQGADRLQAQARQPWRQAVPGGRQHAGPPVRRGCVHQAWVTDITYIRTLEGFAYLAVVIDLYSRRVAGRSMQRRQTTDLVRQALHMAVWRRKPKQRVLIHPTRAQS